MALGTLCAIDNRPRQISDQQIDTLRALARQVVNQIELRRSCSELREISEQLERSNRELEDFTYVAAHDLQEPLRKMISFSSLLEKDLGGDLPERAAQDINYITGAATRMQSLIQDLLKLSRAGTAILEEVDVPLSQCVDQATETLSLRIEETGAVLEVGELPSIMGDPTLLTLLFQNLIGNALKFVTDKTPKIRITCRMEGGRLVIGVQDNGIGIDPKYAEQIFVPFRRLHGRGDFEGTGIGLAITRKVVERHGGGIWVESEPGSGSHFKFALKPAAPQDYAIT
jgi:light-regulated signal transduction histidine kinase (bacteriophytochrome)